MVMTQRQAIRILMLSPCYWLLNVSARKKLIEEYCTSYRKLHEKKVIEQEQRERAEMN